MATLRTFPARINRYADAIETNANKLMKKAGEAAIDAVWAATPVDTSRARANWHVTLNSPSSNYNKNARDKPDTSIITNTRGPNFNPGITDGSVSSVTTVRARAALARRREGQDVFINNNTPYLDQLNSGSSRQAPANFVRKAIIKALSVIKGVRLVPNNVG